MLFCSVRQRRLLRRRTGRLDWDDWMFAKASEQSPHPSHRGPLLLGATSNLNLHSLSSTTSHKHHSYHTQWYDGALSAGRRSDSCSECSSCRGLRPGIVHASNGTHSGVHVELLLAQDLDKVHELAWGRRWPVRQCTVRLNDLHLQPEDVENTVTEDRIPDSTTIDYYENTQLIVEALDMSRTLSTTVPLSFVVILDEYKFVLEKIEQAKLPTIVTGNPGIGKRHRLPCLLHCISSKQSI